MPIQNNARIARIHAQEHGFSDCKSLIGQWPAFQRHNAIVTYIDGIWFSAKRIKGVWQDFCEHPDCVTAFAKLDLQLDLEQARTHSVPGVAICAIGHSGIAVNLASEKVLDRLWGILHMSQREPFAGSYSSSKSGEFVAAQWDDAEHKYKFLLQTYIGGICPEITRPILSLPEPETFLKGVPTVKPLASVSDIRNWHPSDSLPLDSELGDVIARLTRLSVSTGTGITTRLPNMRWLENEPPKLVTVYAHSKYGYIPPGHPVSLSTENAIGDTSAPLVTATVKAIDLMWSGIDRDMFILAPTTLLQRITDTKSASEFIDRLNDFELAWIAGHNGAAQKQYQSHGQISNEGAPPAQRQPDSLLTFSLKNPKIPTKLAPPSGEEILADPLLCRAPKEIANHLLLAIAISQTYDLSEDLHEDVDRREDRQPY